jgi:hypothetical protein
MAFVFNGFSLFGGWGMAMRFELRASHFLGSARPTISLDAEKVNGKNMFP